MTEIPQPPGPQPSYPPGPGPQPPYHPGPGQPVQGPWAAAYGVPPQRPPKKTVLPLLIAGIILTVFVSLGLISSLVTPSPSASSDPARLVGMLMGRLVAFALFLAPGIVLIVMARRRSRSNKAAGWS